MSKLRFSPMDKGPSKSRPWGLIAPDNVDGEWKAVGWFKTRLILCAYAAGNAITHFAIARYSGRGFTDKGRLS